MAGGAAKVDLRRGPVSIATVSHVINKTRYVSSQVEARVNEMIDKTGYRGKIQEKVNFREKAFSCRAG